jgi:hypothetical protein
VRGDGQKVRPEIVEPSSLRRKASGRMALDRPDSFFEMVNPWANMDGHSVIVISWQCRVMTTRHP